MNKLTIALSLCSLLLSALITFPGHAVVPENHVRIHFQRSSGVYTDWGLHVWGRGLDLPRRVTWGTPLMASGEDDFGVYYDVPVLPSAEEFGFIIHRGERKSVKQDLTFNLAENGREVWLYEGDPILYSGSEPGVGGEPEQSAASSAANEALLKQLNEILAQNKALTDKVASYLSSEREREGYLSRLQQENEQLQLTLNESMAHAETLRRQLDLMRQQASDDGATSSQLLQTNEQLQSQILEIQATTSEREAQLQQQISQLTTKLQGAITLDGIASYFKRSFANASNIDLKQGVVLTIFAVLLLILLGFYIRMRRQYLLARQHLLAMQASENLAEEPDLQASGQQKPQAAQQGKPAKQSGQVA